MAEEVQNNGQQANEGQPNNGEQRQEASGISLDDNNWKTAEEIEAAKTKNTSTNDQQQSSAQAGATEDEEIFDENEWVKKEFGFANKDTAKSELEKLRARPEKATEFKFANETSERIAKSLLEGKDEEVFNYLSNKKRLERAEKLDPSKVEDAQELLKLHYQLQHPDLTQSEINFLVNKKYATSKKPEQTTEQTDEAYEIALQEWKDRVADVEQEMVIQAKLARPDLAKFKTQLVLPDIPKAEPQAVQPTPEELAMAQKDRDTYLESVESGLKNLKSYSGTFKDEDVELNAPYVITDEERAKVKTIADSLYSSFDYFINRWKNKDGSMNADLLATDIHRLEYGDRIAQKQISEAAAQQKKHYIKTKGNINVTGNEGHGGQMETKNFQQQQIEYLIANG